MCGPYLALASLAITAASAVSSYEGQKQAAEAQQKAMSQYGMAQSQNILNSTISNYRQAGQQKIYQDAAAAQKIQQNDMSNRAAAATSAASAGDAGVSGISVAALQNEYANRRAEFDTDVAYNEKATDDEIALQAQGFQAQGQSGLNSIQSNLMPASPSPLQPLFDIGAGALNAYNTYLRIPPGAKNTAGTDPNYGAG